MSTQIEKDAEYVAELIRCAALGDSQTVITAAIVRRIAEAERRSAANALHHVALHWPYKGQPGPAWLSERELTLREGGTL